MSAHSRRSLLTTAAAVAALTIFHSARPLAVSAQGRATVTASATVVHADAAWTGHELTQVVLRAAAEVGASSMDDPSVADLTVPWVLSGGSAVHTERNGTVVWVRPAPSGGRPTLVTVAHLGS